MEYNQHSVQVPPSARLTLRVGVWVGFVNASDLEPQLRGSDSSHVTTGAATDHEDIKLLVTCSEIPLTVRRRAGGVMDLPALPSW